jgi:hypothetical protein
VTTQARRYRLNTPNHRMLLAALAKLLRRERWVLFLVTP